MLTAAEIIQPNKKPRHFCRGSFIGGEGGIRTLDTLLTYTHFPGVLLQPLGHLSNKLFQISYVVAHLRRSEEHTSELQSRPHLVCRLLLEKKKKQLILHTYVQ